MTAADLCTLARILLAPVFVYAIAAAASRSSVAPLVICVVAMATDFADGRLARRHGADSVFGRLFDHAADALFLFPGLATLAYLERIPVLMPCAAVLAFTIYLLDGWRHGEAGRIVLTPSRAGAIAGVANYGLATAGAFALAVPSGRLDAAIRAAALVIGLMNVAAALDRVRGMLRPKRPVPA